MKKWNKVALASMTMLAAASTTQAQTTSVTMYGVVDAAVEHLTNAPTGGITRFPNLTGTVPSRLGFRGTEDLGGGLRALFQLEMGFSPDSGVSNQGGRLFGRQAVVGVAGSFGQVLLGRQNTMFSLALQDSDILGPSIYGSSSVDPYIAGARADNAISYRGTFGGVTVGALYSVGRDAVGNCNETAGDNRACRAVSAMLKYDSAQWGIALGTDRLNGGTGAAGGLTRSSLTDVRTVLGGYAKLGAVKLGAGVIRRDNDGSAATPRSNLWYLGAAYQLTPAVVLDGELFRLSFRNSPNEATLAALRATYSLSKRTAVYTTVGHIGNDGTLAISASGGQAGGAPSAGGSQTGVAVGVRHTF